QNLTYTEWALSFIAMAVLAGFIGALINAADLKTIAWTPPIKRRLAVGFIVCFILGLIANYFSDYAFSAILAVGGWGVGHQGSIAYLILARVTGWTLMGALLGAGVGLSTVSLKNVVKGAAGGWVGGFIGGISFDIISSLSGGGVIPRLVGLSAIGLAIGLFIGLVQQLTKAAWLAVEAGRLHGRQYRLEGATVTIGRAEENPVGLFGDRGVQARHALIERHGANYTIRNLAVQEGTFLNGRRIETAALNEGDRIRISNYELSFHLRAGAQAGHGVASPASAAAPASQYPGAASSANARISSSSAAPAVPHASEASPPGPCLVGINGGRFTLRRDATTRVGRALDNDIVLNDGSVSRHHAAIEASDGYFKLRDLQSQNGTWLAGQRVSEAPISDGDLVKLGDAAFTFHA
ncbi:MAG: FHA domain-containing protein, partial [Candidatus Binataceae bacterium]